MTTGSGKKWRKLERNKQEKTEKLTSRCFDAARQTHAEGKWKIKNAEVGKRGRGLW